MTASPSVVAIGNFDGVHVGHRAVLADAEELARELKLPLTVLTFDPHPRLLFQPDAPPFLLTHTATKRALLTGAGADQVVELPFDAALAGLSPEAFIEKILVGELNARHVVVGEGFSFGARRAGTVETLRRAGYDNGRFGVTAVYPVAAADGTVYSSSVARARLAAADFAGAAEILGWPWHMAGTVAHGDKRGRTLGFPTANQPAAAAYTPIPYGIYAVQAQIEGETRPRPGVANFGTRPMFQTRLPLLETYIFDYSGDLYGKNLQITPVKHLRAEMNFPSVEALVAQMEQDCLAAKAVLESAS